jgi:phytanoyl-CoA hydroxylase
VVLHVMMALRELGRTTRRSLSALIGGRRPVAPPLPPLTAAQQRDFAENGFLILRGFFDRARIARLKLHIDKLWQARRDGSPLVIDSYYGEFRAARAYFREVDDDARDYPYKLLDPHLADATVQGMSADARLMSVIEHLLGSRPLVCNTLFFEYGSQQDLHFDTFYMPSKTPNMMAASWIAIDPVTETNGPLIYYPKSHLIEPFRFSHGGLEAIFAEMPAADAHMRDIIARHGLRERRLLADPGDLLIWHAQLLHGGAPIVNRRETRASLVTHYWTECDFPAEADRIDLGDRRFLLKRPHQPVVDAKVWGEVDSFVRDLATPEQDLAAVPPSFDPRQYLLRNRDVFAARIDPYTHYREFGHREGRLW